MEVWRLRGHAWAFTNLWQPRREIRRLGGKLCDILAILRYPAVPPGRSRQILLILLSIVDTMRILDRSTTTIRLPLLVDVVLIRVRGVTMIVSEDNNSTQRY